MRHLLSLIAGVVVAPLAWGLLAMGQAGAGATVEAWAAADAFDTVDLIQPGAYLAAAGVLLGLIATLRLSPTGPLAAAVVYLGLNVGLFIDPFAVRDAVPDNWNIAGEDIPLRAPLLNGTLLAVGALLLIAAFSGQRWRQWPAAAEAEPAGEQTGEPGGQSGAEEPVAVAAGAEGGTAGMPTPRHAVDDLPPPSSGDTPGAPRSTPGAQPE